MKLKTGDVAPEFELPRWDGETVRLGDTAGRRTWLAFFRYASCPLCNLRVHRMIQRHPAWEQSGLRILAVFQSPPESMARYVGEQAPPFPLLCDPAEEVYARFGLDHSKLGFMHTANAIGLAEAATKGFLPGKQEGTVDRLPADFLLSPELEIEDAFYASRIGEHIPFERVDAWLAR